jgi:Zn-finger nucleic acid-binding protein
MNMKCPNCVDTTLVMADRQGVEIDYCPACRGVWLDRGELDKLLDKAVATSPVAPAQNAQHRKRSDYEHAEYRAPQPYYPSKKKSWLNEIFD